MKTLDDLQSEMGAAEKKPVQRHAPTEDQIAAFRIASKAFGAVVLQGITPALQAAVKATEAYLTQVKALEGMEQWQRNKARYERRYKKEQK